jgi:hypothetical protein
LGILEHRLGRFFGGREGRNSLSAPLKELWGNKKKLEPHQKSKLTCPVCKKLIDCEKRYVVSFIKHFDDPEFNISFVSSFGLCLPHLILSLKLCENKDIIRKLLKIELKKLKSLKQELREFKRKHDFQFSKESFGKEKDSWIRVIEKLIGKEGIY